jgi:hypothetical protein
MVSFYLSEPNQGHLNIEWVPPENIIIIKLITVYLTDQSSEQLFYLKLENFVIANLIDWIFIIGMNSVLQFKNDFCV